MRRAAGFLLKPGYRKHNALAAELNMLQLPEQLLDCGIGGLGIQTGPAGLLKVIFHRFSINHGFSIGSV